MYSDTLCYRRSFFNNLLKVYAAVISSFNKAFKLVIGTNTTQNNNKTYYETKNRKKENYLFGHAQVSNRRRNKAIAVIFIFRQYNIYTILYQFRMALAISWEETRVRIVNQRAFDDNTKVLLVTSADHFQEDCHTEIRLVTSRKYYLSFEISQCQSVVLEQF